MYMCPLCNGLNSITVKCSQCGSEVQDSGRISDYYGPYSPYRPIDDLNMTDGFDDAQQHSCPHVIYCPTCKQTSYYFVNEWDS